MHRVILWLLPHTHLRFRAHSLVLFITGTRNPDENNLEKEQCVLGSWFQRFSPWSAGAMLCASAEAGRRGGGKKAAKLMAAGKQRESKEPGTRYHPQGEAPR